MGSPVQCRQLDALLLARYEQVARPDALRWNDWLHAQLDKIATSMAALEATPERLQGRVDIGTLTLGCAVWYLDLRFSDLDWRPRYPKFARWAEAFSQRPSTRASWSL